MILRYMIDYVRQRDDEYTPVGIWVQGNGPGIDFEQFYGESNLAKERESEAVWVINRLVEYGVTSLPSDFLDYHRGQRNPYEGNFSEIVETNEYGSIQECGLTLIRQISNFLK